MTQTPEQAEVEAADAAEDRRSGGSFTGKYLAPPADLPTDPAWRELNSQARSTHWLAGQLRGLAAHADDLVLRIQTVQDPQAVARQAEIDAAETARVEALLQVCRWAVNDEYLATGAEEGTSELAMLVLALQYDQAVIEDQLHVYVQGLVVLVHQWSNLPVDGRAVVLAGLVPAGRLEEWDRVRAAYGPLRWGARHRLLTDFARSVLGL